VPRLTSRLFQRRHAAWWTFVAGLAATVALTWTLHHEARTLDRKRLAQRAAEVQTMLDSRLERSEMLLHNLRDYLMLSGESRNQIFAKWCYENGLTINCPWILGITVATNRNEVDARATLPGPPASWTKEEWMTLYHLMVNNPIECQLALRSSVTNGHHFLEDYDLRCSWDDRAGENPTTSRTYLASAIRWSRLCMGERQSVMLDTHGQPVIGTVFYVPIYRPELTECVAVPRKNNDHLYARWVHLSAVIVAPVDFNRLFGRSESETSDLGLEIFSSTNQLTAETWLNSDRPKPRADDPAFHAYLTHRLTWPMYGQRFSLFFYTTPLFEAQSPRRLAKTAGLAGLAVTLLATALVAVSVRARNRQDGLTGQIREARDALAAAQRERERISRDLHDGTIQSLYAIQLGLGHTAMRMKSEPGNAGSELFAVRRELNAVIAEIRQFILTETAEEAVKAVDLATVLHALVQRARAGTTARVEWRSDTAASARLTSDQAVQLANIAREALSNALRHGRPQQVNLELRLEGEFVVLEVVDDGVGFNPDARGRVGLGLLSMTVRAEESGGTLDLASSPGRGTRVVVKMPVGPAELVEPEKTDAPEREL
jgi:signal transduction histidine kinase